MEFLNEIGESDRLTAEVVLNDESLSNAEKMDILQGMGLEECIIHLASKYLNPEVNSVYSILCSCFPIFHFIF
jgi:hypothetical protein